MQNLIDEIHTLLKDNTDADYLKSISVLVPSNQPILGVRVPVIRNLVKQWHQANKLPYEQVIVLIDDLFSRQIREEMVFAVLLLQKYKKHYDQALFDKADGWIELIENWEVCDQLASSMAPVVAKNPVLFERLEQWTKADNFWRRRFVLATGASLNHHGLSHVEQVLSLCEPLVGDDEAMVEKAWHWAVREVSKKDPDATFERLLGWRDRLKKGVLRQAAEKLSDCQKAKLLAN